MTKDEALKLALEALEKNDHRFELDRYEKGGPTRSVGKIAITAIREALAQPEQEPVRLRRGDILRCIETDELCTVWATSTTGKTQIKWSANDFSSYTAEQIGELFWLEPEPNDLELAAEKSDNYSAFHAGYKFAIAHTAPPHRKPLTHPQIHELDWPDSVSFEDILPFVRAIEAAHGIKGEA